MICDQLIRFRSKSINRKGPISKLVKPTRRGGGGGFYLSTGHTVLTERTADMLAPYQAGGHFLRWRPTFLASTRQPGLIYEFFEANESPYYGRDPIRF